MKKANSLFDPETLYRVEIEDQVDVAWLIGFDSSVEINSDENRKAKGITVLNIRTDQSGIVGLIRRLHGLGITIRQFEIIAQQGDEK